MKISVLKRAIVLCREADITSMLWGAHGVGKSSAVRQLCRDNHWGMIDYRLAQCESSDLRGIPAKDEATGRTVFYPPAEMPMGDMTWEEVQKKIDEAKDYEKEAVRTRLQSRIRDGVLLLDEVNRAQDDVANATFQLILDRKVGLYTLPPGWSIVCAGNFMEGYFTNGFTDPAFLDRMCHLTLSADELTLPEWVEYMNNTHGDTASSVIEFTSQNMKHLYADVKAELGFSIQPSPRSWDAVARVESVCKTKEYGNDVRMAVISGLVGKDLAMSYINYSCPVKPMDLIQQGVEALHPKLKTLERNQLTGLMWGFAGMIKKRLDDDEIGKVAIDFTRWMVKNANDKDIAVAFCSILIGNDTTPQRIKAALISNPNVGQLIQRFQGNAPARSFLSRLVRDPLLHSMLSRISWNGSTEPVNPEQI